LEKLCRERDWATKSFARNLKERKSKTEEQIKKLSKLSEDNQERYDEELREDMLNRKTMIISVIYEDNKQPKKFDEQSRTYSYYTQLETLQVNDIVDCPVRKK